MKRAGVLIVALLSLAALAFASSQASSPPPDLVSVVVTVLNRRSGPIPRVAGDGVVVRQNGEVRPVVDWKPLSGAQAGLDLAVLVDDSLASSIAQQWAALRKFIGNLPSGSRVAVVYGTGGGASFAQRFTTDRALAAKALRLPHGSINEGASIYLSLQSLLKDWPADNNRRVVVLLSDGIDLFYGARNSEPGLNRNLRDAIAQAQEKGVIVDAIYAGGAGSFSRNFRLVSNGQSCLSRLGRETGGSLFTSGMQSAVSIEPFLDRIETDLAQQYRLTFRAKLPSSAGFARLQLATEQHGIELRAAKRVYLPAAR